MTGLGKSWLVRKLKSSGWWKSDEKSNLANHWKSLTIWDAEFIPSTVYSVSRSMWNDGVQINFFLPSQLGQLGRCKFIFFISINYKVRLIHPNFVKFTLLVDRELERNLWMKGMQRSISLSHLVLRTSIAIHVSRVKSTKQLLFYFDTRITCNHNVSWEVYFFKRVRRPPQYQYPSCQ